MHSISTAGDRASAPVARDGSEGGRAPRELRRAQIVEAALGCLATAGYHGTTMDDLARAAGLSKGSLYWHFSSKEEVLVALFRSFTERFFEAWAPERRGTEPPLTVIREGFRLLVDELLSRRELSQVWLEFFSHPTVRELMADVYRRSRALLATLLEDAMARGAVRPGPTEAMAAAFTAVAEGLLLQAIVDPEFDALGACDVALDGLVRGLGR